MENDCTHTVSFGAILKAKRQGESRIIFEEVRRKWIPPEIVCVLPNSVTHVPTCIKY